MDQRTRILTAAETLLDASPDRDFSTRALCEAAGIGAPMLYRLFGDKDGLMRALVDHGFDRYLAGKRAADVTGDPVADLREGWNSHIAFARAHPAVYRLMYSPNFSAVPDAAYEAVRLLSNVLKRCAADGVLRVDVPQAAQAIMSANIGVALSLLTQPDTYADPHLSDRVRDAVHHVVLTDAAFGPRTPPAGDLAQLTVRGAAARLDDLLATQPELTLAENALLREWLRRLQYPHRQLGH